MAAESGSVAGLLRGSCAICQSAFTSTGKIAALTCGHTFHFVCVSQWLGVKKECPNCRKKITKTGMIEKLFFDISAFDGNETKCEIDYAEKAETLTTELQQEKEAHAEKTRKLTDLQNSVKSLEKKIVREKDRYDKRVPALEARNRHLELMASDSDALKTQLNQAKAKLKASSFFDYLVRTEGEDKAENELATYLKGSGAIESEKFFELMRKQNKGLSVKLKKADKEFQEANEKIRPLKKEIQNKNDIIAALRKEIEQLRQMASVDTPINKKLRSILLNGNDQKRVSMGFDRTNLMEETLNETFLSPTAEKGANKEQWENKPCASSSSGVPPTFTLNDTVEIVSDSPILKKKGGFERRRLSSDDDSVKSKNKVVCDSDEDDPPIFKKLGFQRKRVSSESDEAKKTARTTQDDSLDFSFDISVPASVMRRTVAPATKVAKPLNKAPQANSESGPTTKMITDRTDPKFGKALKRVLSQDDKQMNPKKPASQNARISSFFSRNPPINDENIVTID